MTLIESLMVALSTYSRIPMPNFKWNEKNMKYAICFFPIVGIICGVFAMLWSKLGTFLNVSNLFLAMILVCIPLLITGGIHMDGFMDTVDALSSYQPREKKLEILRDPHCGAFAVIYCGIYLVLNIAVVYEICSLGSIAVMCPIYFLSRCLSAVCAVNLPNARRNGMLSGYTENADKKIVNSAMGIFAAACMIVMLAISFVQAVTALLSGFLWTVLYCKMVKKQFGGVTGDTAGFFLQIFELCCMLGVWLGAVI